MKIQFTCILLFLVYTGFGQQIRYTQLKPIEGDSLRSTNQTAGKFLKTTGTNKTTWAAIDTLNVSGLRKFVEDYSINSYSETDPVYLSSSWYGTTNNATNWNTAFSNRINSFTTSGNSGAATFSGNTLNIPNYTLAGLGGIGLTGLSSSATGLSYNNTNGVFSLTYGYTIPTTTSADTWNTAYNSRINSATLPLSFSGNTLSISQATTASNGYLSSTDWNTFNNKQPLKWLTHANGLYYSETPLGFGTTPASDAQINISSSGLAYGLNSSTTATTGGALFTNSYNGSYGLRATGTYIGLYGSSSVNYGGYFSGGLADVVLAGSGRLLFSVPGESATGKIYASSNGRIYYQYSNGTVYDLTTQGGMIYPAAGIPVSTGSGWATTSITDNSANWNTAFSWGNHAGLYSSTSHNHNSTYEPLISKSNGYLYRNGAAWEWKNESYSLSNHQHGSITSEGKIGNQPYIPLITTTNGVITGGSFGNSSGTFAEGNHNHSGIYDTYGTATGLINSHNSNYNHDLISSAYSGRLTAASGSSPLTLTLSSNQLSGSIADATTLNKGVSSFNSNYFTVSSGAVSVKEATTSVKGVASFNSNHFDVSNGAVSLKSGAVDNSILNRTAITGQTIAPTLNDANTILIDDGSGLKKTTLSSIKNQIGNSDITQLEAQIPAGASGQTLTAYSTSAGYDVYLYALVEAFIYETTTNKLTTRSAYVTLRFWDSALQNADINYINYSQLGTSPMYITISGYDGGNYASIQLSFGDMSNSYSHVYKYKITVIEKLEYYDYN